MLAKLFGCESSIAGDAAHGVGVNRTVARNGVNALPVGHDDVLSLTSDTEVEFLKHPDGIEMIDARDLRHELGDLDLADHRVLQQLVAHGKVLPDGVSDVGESFGFRGPCDQHPGRPGTEALYPSSERWRAILYFIGPPMLPS